jgi:hypothetical protein
MLIFPTASARSAVELVNLQFTGELAVTEDGTWVRRIDPNRLQYVGPPSDAIDNAWGDLIRRGFSFRA